MENSLSTRTGAVVAELDALMKLIDYNQVARLTKVIATAPAVFVAGAGRSALMLKAGAMRLAHLGRPVHVVGDVVTPAIAPDDGILIASGSGETGGLVHIATKAKQAGARLALITANSKSTLAGMAEVVVTIPAPNPRTGLSGSVASVQPMGNLFEQAVLLLMDVMTMELMDFLAVTEDSMQRRHANLE